LCEDTYGFSALPGGACYAYGCDYVGYEGKWWSTDSFGGEYANHISMTNDNEFVLYGVSDKSNRLSVRCLKNGDNDGGSSSSVGGVVYGEPVTHGTETYQTVVIGTQIWFAKNLNYNVSGSKCYDNSESNCNIYGRLYDWSTAMDIQSWCNSDNCPSQIQPKHRGICPGGWHIPSNADWDKLFRYADGTSGTSSPYTSPTAGRYLKATSGWNSDSNWNGTDQYGFSALPGGYGYSAGTFYNVGDIGYWWTANENYSLNAYYRYMDYDYYVAFWDYDFKYRLFSVRCVQD
jgi:uncharacterized protein (TIGR02145 family)